MTKLIQYKIGDFVKIKNFRARLNHSKSLEPKFLGPFKILRMLGDLNYELVNEKGKLEKVHYNRKYVYKATDDFKFSVKTKLVKSKTNINKNKIEFEDNKFVVIPIIRKSLRLKQLERRTEAERYQRFLELERILPHEPDENDDGNNDGLTKVILEFFDKNLNNNFTSVLFKFFKIYVYLMCIFYLKMFRSIKNFSYLDRFKKKC